MSDLFNQVMEDKDPLTKILSKIPGFKGYIEQGARKDADKLLRETVANRYDGLWQRLSALQTELLNQGGLMYMDELESAAIKLRTFSDRIRNASYGYSSVFEAVQIKNDEAERLYAFDLALLEGVDQIDSAIGNVEASLGTDGLPAAIRHLVTMARQSVETYDKREETILSL